ncbi:MAG TPA: hypothetical protein VE935_24520 [Burkholderiales bacterium]|nr:hypothetical protein [Burkholderiales bacterium]
MDFAGQRPPGSLCQASGESLHALIAWDARWRPDQKEPAKREAMAEQGIRQFAARSACYATTEVRRGTNNIDSARADRVVMVTVRELGPVLKLFSSLALIDGGTEVVLDIASFVPGRADSRVEFSEYWRNGGHGVIKGVASLPDDMEAALAAALRPARIPKKLL